MHKKEVKKVKVYTPEEIVELLEQEYLEKVQKALATPSALHAKCLKRERKEIVRQYREEILPCGYFPQNCGKYTECRWCCSYHKK